MSNPFDKLTKAQRMTLHDTMQKIKLEKIAQGAEDTEELHQEAYREAMIQIA